MLSDIGLINFIDMTLDEKKMVLTWRNNKSIKQWMHNSDSISMKKHLVFIETLKSSTDKLYFLLKQRDSYIGVIDFTNIDKKNRTCEFGLYGNIELKGIGKTLLNAICEYAFKNLNIKILIAEVFRENQKAINLYKEFNFQEVTRKKLDEKDIICMELKNEDR